MSVVEVMVPQTHPLGAEAEVDFGNVSFYLGGLLTEGWMFLMRLSASGRGFHRVYLNQAQQVFLDGHVRALEHFGAVPRRIRYENVPRNIFVVMWRGALCGRAVMATAARAVNGASAAVSGT
jgi:hypothetical protein